MSLTNKGNKKMIEKNENKKEVIDLVYRLNTLEGKYQHYMTNIDNIYAWACEQYNTDKPTAKQQESICEYPQNMSDYEKLTDKIAKKQKDIIANLGSNWAIEVEYDGWDYKIKECK
tara:strand:+ start:183 stop:530 length:348 start_codon:yes stop_codon:yes gene_type:complete